MYGADLRSPTDPTRTITLIAICTSIHLLVTLFFAARAYSRLALLHAWRLDDYVLTFAWLTATALAILIGFQAHYGAGQHIHSVSVEAVDKVIVYANVFILVYQTALATTKLSICLSYIRIFRAEGSGRMSILLCAGFITLSYFASQALWILQCDPQSAVWKLDPRRNGRCLDLRFVFAFGPATNILGDVWIIVALLPRILRLRLERRQKISLLIVVSLGWLVVAAAVLRLVRLIYLASTPHADLLYYFFDLCIYSSAEVNAGIFCASIHAIKPLLKCMFPRRPRPTWQHEQTRTKQQSVYLGMGLNTSKSRGSSFMDAVGFQRSGRVSQRELMEQWELSGLSAAVANTKRKGSKDANWPLVGVVEVDAETCSVKSSHQQETGDDAAQIV